MWLLVVLTSAMNICIINLFFYIYPLYVYIYIYVYVYIYIKNYPNIVIANSAITLDLFSCLAHQNMRAFVGGCQRLWLSTISENVTSTQRLGVQNWCVYTSVCISPSIWCIPFDVSQRPIYRNDILHLFMSSDFIECYSIDNN